MLNKIKILIHYILPKLWITKLIGILAELQGGWITHWIIKMFIKKYKVNMQDAKQQTIENYKTFNDFFIRELKHNARPIDPDPKKLVIPADGIITQIGQIHDKFILQAKNNFYNLDSLLAGNDNMIHHFIHGSFVTIYLSPKDYHRVHMPCDGVLREVLYIPGSLFSVNPIFTKNISNIFAKNERLICLFETDFGPIAQIMIGAIIMGSIETVWLGKITPPREGIIKHWNYQKNTKNKDIILLKGQEMGLFKLGSTVINLFGNNKIIFNQNLQIDNYIKVGTYLAHKISKKNII